MPRDLFGDVPQPVGSRSRYTVPVSLAAHAAILLAIAAATILGPVVLPGLASSDPVYISVITIPPAPPPPPRRSAEPVRPAVNPNAAPTVAPTEILPEPTRVFDVADDSSTPGGIVPGAASIDTIVGVPPPPPVPVAPKPVRPGGDIRPPTKVSDAAPIYPLPARAARIEGAVIIEATIGVDGTIQSARVLRSPPLLGEAALTAVRQWMYTPTLLNGVPVPVIMTITVMFRLN
jgi:periplasmic protein TonB